MKTAVTSLILFSAVLSVSTANKLKTGNIEGFTYLGSSSKTDGLATTETKDIYVSNAAVNHATANLECSTQIDGNLVKIQNSNQNTQIRNHLEALNIGTNVWTAGKRDSGTGPWYWSTNLAPIVWTNWKAGHPVANQNCLTVGGLGLSYGWTSATCTSHLRYICEV